MKPVARCVGVLAITIFAMGDNDLCGNWTAQHRTDVFASAQLEAWVLGYLSGWASTSFGPDPLAKTDHMAVIEWVNKYCSEHPLDSLSQAVVRLTAELGKKSN